jgi:hypothetical protein
MQVPESDCQMIYRLSPGVLELRSLVLWDLFSLPSPEAHGGMRLEGTCDENPIILYDIIHHEFDYHEPLRPW